MIYALASIVLLLISPFLQKVTMRYHRLHQIVQFILVLGVGFYAVFHILPASYKQVGGGVIPAAIAGFGLIWLTERFWMTTYRGAYFTLLMVAIVGIILHSISDGAMIAFATVSHDGAYDLTGKALLYLVFIHQIPVGAFIWSVVVKKFNEATAWLMIVGMSLATLVGYFAAQEVAFSLLSSPQFGYFQAFVIGSLLHIGFEPFVHGKSHACDC